ncbi:hypothetical protein FRB95_001293 [Tulasnella sp. JGI-2019a]|nr:hypothetical protein FRB93_006489 [Tulasnella sp. JGI-2019a]KAG9038436.1 hypothetical protein FRB95_001293 [Tulasnella sp. JGI-2019a]
MQDAMMNELDRLESLSSLHSEPIASSSTSAPPSIGESLDNLLAHLQHARHSVDINEDFSNYTFSDLKKKVETHKKRVDERQKQVHGSMTKFGKLIDKKFTNILPSSPPLFSSVEAVTALERVIGSHFLRSGAFDVANVFYAECGTHPPERERANFARMYDIVQALKQGDLEPALQWTVAARDFLQTRHSTLEFELHRSRYLRVLLEPLPDSFPIEGYASTLPPTSLINPAYQYSRTHFPSLYRTHSQCTSQLNRLTTILIYARNPGKLASSKAYGDLADADLRSHEGLERMFVREWCKWMNVSARGALKEVAGLGGNGALARIEKGRKVMAGRKPGPSGSSGTEAWWDANEEIMIEIPVPPNERYHSVFACPVSKEQTTEKNPPMMLICGHILAKDSVTRLTKSGGRIKCPYCPVESTDPPLQVHF